MSWPFSCTVIGGGRGLLVRRGPASIAEFAFGLPGEPVEGWEPDDADARLTLTDAFTARLRHQPDDEGWVTTVSLDNTSDDTQALPPLGVAVSVAPGWVGWSWSTDVEGFLVVAPADGPGECLLVSVRRGFWRAAASVPVFTPADRRGDALGAGVAAFHLAHPTGSLRAYGRHQTTLEFSAITVPDAAAATLPPWLPELVVAPGDELVLHTPDQAIVPGPGVQVTETDSGAVLLGSAGQREVAVHGVRGVQRLRMTCAPALPALVGELAGEAMRTRPSGVASASAAVVASGLARRVVVDASAALDWLEREDWLARGDLWGPAIAGVVANETHDAGLVEDACAALLAADPLPGMGIIGSRLWLATLRAGLPPFDLMAVFARAGSGLSGLESAVLRNADAARWGRAVRGLVARLGAGLPGQPVGLAEADAGLAVALLRHVPEGWAEREAATLASEKAAALLLADHADRLHPAHDGLAWLLMGEISA